MPLHRTGFALRSLAVFDGLSNERLDEIAQVGQWSSVPPGTHLMPRGEESIGLLMMVSGQARITTYSLGGREITFRDIGAGECFGFPPADPSPALPIDVITLTSSVVMRLNRPYFLRLLRDEPAVAERCIMRLMTTVQDLARRVVDLSTLGVTQRLHAELLRLARATGSAGPTVPLTPGPRHADIASRISTNREQVTRELAQLARDGLLAKDGKSLVITDLRHLEQLVAEVHHPRA